MTDPRRLSEAVLAAIVKRVARDQDPNLPPNVREISIDRYDLSRHIAWQAEQIDLLIDAHRERQDLLAAMTQKVMEQSSQLAEAETTITERVATIHALMTIIDAHDADMGELGGRCDKALDDLATEKAARVASESRMAELVGHYQADHAVMLTVETLRRLKEITADWGNTLNEVAEGAIVAGIRVWEQEDQEMRASGITVEKVGERQWKATFATGGTDGAE